MIDSTPITYEQLVILTRWMAAQFYAADEVAYAVEKPHKFREELATALAELEEQIKVSHE